MKTKLFSLLFITIITFFNTCFSQSQNQNYILSTQYLEHVLVDDDFISSFGAWETNNGASLSLENGQLKINVRNSWSGIRNPLNGFKTISGKTLRVKINFQQGNTSSNVRLYLEERGPNGNLISWNEMTNNLSPGESTFTLLMNNDGNTITFRIDKNDTNTSTNSHFFIESVSLQIDNNTTIDKLENITYIDGFGKAKQSVVKRITPNQKDVVQHIEYDEFGRESKRYLALPSNQNTGNYVANSRAQTESYYQNAFADQHPFFEVRYDNSPLSRELESTAPGNTWQLIHNSDNDHTEKRDYNVNASGEVQRFMMNGEGQALTVSSYNPRMLFKNIVKNENWTPTDGKLNTTEVFKDKNGRTVAEFNFEENAGALKTLKTVYVYDIAGNLRYVLPPKLIDNIVPPPPPTNYSDASFSWPTAEFVTPADMQGNVTLNINNNTLTLSMVNLISISGRSSNVSTSSSKSKAPIGIIEDPGSPILDPIGDPIDDPIGDPIPDPIPDPPTPVQTYVLNSQTIRSLNTSPTIPDMFLGDIMVFNSNFGGNSFSFKVGEASISNGNLVITRTSTLAFTHFSTTISIRLNQLSLPTLPVNLLDDLAFQYEYDQFNRQIAQKVPGKGWEYLVYDKLDRPILTQDANLRAQNKWMFNKYDVYGRVAYSGLYTNNSSREALQNQVDNFINNSTNKDNAVSRTTTTNNIGGVHINYSNNAFPNTNQETLKVNYYDDYNFTDTNLPTIPTQVLGQQVTTRLRGMQTAAWTKTLGANSWSKEYNIYDNNGRIISVYSKNHLGGFTEEKGELDFRGKILTSITSHKRVASSPNLVVEDSYEYDHAERLVRHLQKINNQPQELIASNSYNELGRLESKGIGGDTTNQLQTIDYTYNIRGWVKRVNNPNNLGSDVFGYTLNYVDPVEGSATVSTPYNGYIKQTVWKSAHTGLKKSYAYEYDKLNRFKTSIYRENNSLTGGGLKFRTSDIDYDSNGNILKLRRWATSSVPIDDLEYSYDNGNKLTNIMDSNAPGAQNGYHNFHNNPALADFEYDANGNLIRDRDKKISSIQYNHLDLVERVVFSTGHVIEFDYDARGTKLAMRNIFSGSTTSVDYLGGFQYTNTQLQFFPTQEGYAYKDGGTYKYVYTLTDHLGNNRVSFRENNGAATIIGNTDYYVMGLPHQGEFISGIASNYNYKYQGKEKLEFADYNMYDFGSRMYDPAVGRWFNTDPQNQFYSPYLAMGNNGVMMIDPDGELAFLAAIVKVAKVIAKAAKVAKAAAKAAKAAKAAAKVAKVSTLTAKGIKTAKISIKAPSILQTPVASTATNSTGFFAKGWVKSGLKSGAINTLASYDPKKGLGWHTLGAFGAGFAGGAVGVAKNSKLYGMATGGVANWGVNGANFNYEGLQHLVGGALSSYQGIGKKVTGGKLFKLKEGGTKMNKLLYKHGNNFVKYGLQNTAYDFAYSKQEDFAKRGWNHLTGFAWGGVSGAYQQANFGEKAFATSLLYQGVVWGVNGAIKKNFKGIKVDGSQLNKGFISYLKWMNDIMKL